MSQALQPMTEAEYLAWEQRQERPFEFDGFRPVAMNGGTIGHERIQGNLKFALMQRLRGGRCEALGPTARVPTGRGRHRYPDAVISCSVLDNAQRDVQEPVVIFEIMSETTVDIDRRTKLVEYRSIPSLVRYVMLEQTAVMATVIARREDHWSIDVLRGDDILLLPEVGIELPLAELYQGLDLPPEDP